MSTITTRLGGLMKMLRSDRPVEVEVGDAHRRGFWSRRPGGGRDAAVEELKRGYGETLDLMRAMRDHMDQQAEYNRAMLTLLQRLPDALGSLPETNRNQARMLETLHTHFEHQSRQTGRLTEALGSLAHTSDQQTQVLGLMQQQIEASREVEQQRCDALTTMNSTLARVSASADASAQAIRFVCDSQARIETRTEERMTRTVRNMTAMMVAGGVATALAVGAATYALMVMATGA